jgi:HD domain
VEEAGLEASIDLSDREEQLVFEATAAAAEKVEAEGTLFESSAADELAARDAALESFEGEGGQTAPAAGQETGEAVEEPALPGRRPRGQAGRRFGARGHEPRGIGMVVPLAALGAAVTLVVSIVFTKPGKIDYGNFLFFLVIFTLCAFFSLELRGGSSLSLGLAPLLAALIALPVSLPNVPYGKIAAAGCVQVVWVFLFGTAIVLITRLFGEFHSEDLVAALINYTGVGFAALFFYALMKMLPQGMELNGHYTPALLGTVAFCSGVLYLFYIGQSTYLMAQEGHFSPGAYLQSVLRRSWFPFLTVGFVGTLMGLIFVGIGMWSSLFVLPLLAVILYAYNRLAATDQYLMETIRVLSSIPEETGRIEPGHGHSVAQLSAGVARELGLSPDDVRQVMYAAYLHDIGAITKEGAPGEEQRQLTEVEGVIAGGVDILGQVDYLEVAAEILRGREGLRDRVTDVDKRRAVSLGAGILRAVDDFETLLHGDGTREPLSANDALTEMNLERGVRYDSKVLRAIARVYPRLPKEGLTPVVGGSSEEPEFWSEQ